MVVGFVQHELRDMRAFKRIMLLEELHRLEKYLAHRDSNDPYDMCTEQQLYYQSHDDAYYEAQTRREEILRKLGWMK